MFGSRTLLIAQVSDSAEDCAGKHDAYHQQKQHAFVGVLSGQAAALKGIGPGVGRGVDDADISIGSKAIVLDR